FKISPHEVVGKIIELLGQKPQDAKEILGDLLGNKKTDSVPTNTGEKSPKKEDEVKEKAKNILGGFLGAKKKDTAN
ncbi:hypothetical protein LCGC14_3149620, partial [marine sediment metagenome]